MIDMWKLIIYECNKLWNRKWFFLLVILLLIGNTWFIHTEEIKQHDDLINIKAEYYSKEANYKHLNPATGSQRAIRDEELLSKYSIFVLEELESQNEVWRTMAEESRADDPEAYSQYTESPYYANSKLINRDLLVVSRLKDQYTYFEQFKQQITSMEQRADEMKSVSIFAHNGTFSYRNIEKTVQDFKPLQELPLRLGLEEGLTAGTKSGSTDLILILLIFLLCTLLFQFEKEQGLIKLYRATPLGRLDLLASKLIILAMLISLFTLLAYGTVLWDMQRLYGFGDMSRYIQSMPAFANAAIPITVEQFLIYFIILKLAVNLLLGFIMAVLFLLFQNAGAIYFSLSLLVGSSLYCYFSIHPNGEWNTIKYLNIAAFYDSFQLLADYRNLNLIGTPIQKIQMTLWGMGTLLLVLPLICVWLTVKGYSLTIRAFGIRLIHWCRRLPFAIKRYNSLFPHELYKLMYSGKTLFILILAFALAYQMVDKQDRRFDFDTATYNRYISEVDGLLTNEKLQFLQTERARFDSIPGQVTEIYQRYKQEEVSLSIYYRTLLQLQEYSKQEKAFRFIEEQKDYLLYLKTNQGITGSFINENSSNQLFQRQQEDLFDGLLLILLVLTGISPLIAMDERFGMTQLQRSTPQGRGSLFMSKQLVANIYAIFLLILLQFPKYINVLKRYPGWDWNSPVQSIKLLERLSWKISILDYVILTNLLQIFGVFVMVQVAVLLAVIIRKQAYFLLISTLFFALPIGLHLLGATWISPFTFNLIFQLYYAFQEYPYFIGIFIYFFGLLLAGIIASWASWHIYCKGGFSK